MTQLDLLDLLAGEALCNLCGHARRSHYLPEVIREDRRACRVFCCHCPVFREAAA